MRLDSNDASVGGPNDSENWHNMGLYYCFSRKLLKILMVEIARVLNQSSTLPSLE
jgi:hypothetical protein